MDMELDVDSAGSENIGADVGDAREPVVAPGDTSIDSRNQLDDQESLTSPEKSVKPTGNVGDLDSVVAASNMK